MTNHDAVRAVLPDVSRETLARLDRFAALFERWSARINLTSAASGPDLWTRHIADSAQLVRFAPDARHWADFGSGGGFPGAVIAVLFAGTPGTLVDLIESNRRKASFLQSVRAGCAPGAIVHAARIETMVPRLAPPQIVTARALAPLSDLLAMAEPWLSGGSRALFHKGRGYAVEVEESRDRWHFDLVEHPSLIAPDAAVLEIRNLRAKD